MFEFAIHERHLEFVFEIAQDSKPANDSNCSGLMRIIDEQAIEGIDSNLSGHLMIPHRFPTKFDPFFFAKERRLGAVSGKSDDHFVEQLGRPSDDIKMSVRDRIEGPRIDDYSRFRCHAA